MAPSDDLIRKKVLQQELLAVQWDRQHAWNQIQATLPGKEYHVRFGWAASITIALLVLSFHQTTDHAKTVNQFESYLKTAPLISEPIVVKHAEVKSGNVVAKKPAAMKYQAEASVQQEPQTTAVIVTDNAITGDAESIAASTSSVESLPNITEGRTKIRPIIGVIPTESADVATSTSGPRLVLGSQDENPTKKESHSKLVLARIK